MVQACQGNGTSKRGDAQGIGKDFPHIELTISETILMMASVFGKTCNRSHFIPAIAKYLGKPDGRTSLQQMFTRAINDCHQQQRVELDCDNHESIILSTAREVILPMIG